MDKCYRCGVQPGQLHINDCTGEECPFCTGNLSLCDCPHHELNLPYIPSSDLIKIAKLLGMEGVHEDDMPKEKRLTFECLINATKELTAKQNKKWFEVLEKKGRIRYRGGKLYDAPFPNKLMGES